MTEPSVPPVPPVPPERAQRLPVAMLVGVALAVLIVVVAASFFGRSAADGASAAPDGGPARVELHGLVIAREPAPRILRSLGSDGRLVAGEALMLRARISSPSFLFLLAQRPGGVAEPIWPAVAEVHPSGEFELDEGGQPLVLEPSLFGDGTRLVLLACPLLLDAGALRTRDPLADSAAARRAFPSCAAAALPVSMAAPAK